MSTVDLRLVGLDTVFRRITGRAARAAEAPFRKRARAIVAAAKAAWPVDSGRSRRQLRADVYLTTDGVLVEVTSPATYTTAIQGDPWTTLVAEPMRTQFVRQVAPEVVESLARVIAEEGR